MYTAPQIVSVLPDHPSQLDGNIVVKLQVQKYLLYQHKSTNTDAKCSAGERVTAK
jgi:hypothetical protein